VIGSDQRRGPPITRMSGRGQGGRRASDRQPTGRAPARGV